MQIDPNPQGTPEWRAARLGKITVSRFGDVLTQPQTKVARERGDLSKTAESYALDLIAERLTGQDQGPPTTAAMRHGIVTEPEAIRVYEAITGQTCDRVGFVSHPTIRNVGGSPDGMIGDDGGIEVKCPFNTRIHLSYVLAGVLPAEHVAQVQGLLWVTGRSWWDFVSYDPRLPDVRQAFFLVRVGRNEPYIKRLESKVIELLDCVERAEAAIRKGKISWQQN